MCAGGKEDSLAVFPLFPFETADDPQLVRIAPAAGDEELAHQTVVQSEHRSGLSPQVSSLRGAAAHARGLSARSIEHIETAVALFAEGCRPSALAAGPESSRLIPQRGQELAAVAAQVAGDCTKRSARLAWLTALSRMTGSPQPA